MWVHSVDCNISSLKNECADPGTCSAHHVRLFVALGGGGKRGTPPLDNSAEDPLPEPSKLAPVVGLFKLRPGIAIENVCPSLRV
jgi:hypothetical protein